jgi:hypothetical protein
LVAATILTSTDVGRSSPTRSNSPSWIARSSLAWAGAAAAPHLVEEERAAVGQLEASLAVHGGAGEGALAVAEELALPHLDRHRGAVDPHVGAVRPRTVLVEHPRQQLLAGARLPAQQHGRVRGRGRLHHAHGAQPGRAHAQQRARRRRAAQVAHLAPQRARLQRAGECDLQRPGVGGLQDEIAGAGLEALDRGADAAMARQDHDRHLGRRLLQAAHQVQARQLRHAQVGEDHVHRRALQQPQRLRDARSTLGPEAAGAEQLQQRVPHVRLVLDHQHARAWLALAQEAVPSITGSVMRNTAPPPSRGSTFRSPSCWRAAWQTESLSPSSAWSEGY